MSMRHLPLLAAAAMVAACADHAATTAPGPSAEVTATSCPGAGRTFDGRGTLVSRTDGSGTTRFVDTGPLNACGGSLSNSAITSTDAGFLFGRGLPGVTTTGDQLHEGTLTTASGSDIKVTTGGHTLLIGIVTASASAGSFRFCAGNPAPVSSGNASLSWIKLDGSFIVPTGPNQLIIIPGGVGQLPGTLILNEQIQNNSPTQGSFTVNGAHLTLIGGKDVVVGSASATSHCS